MSYTLSPKALARLKAFMEMSCGDVLDGTKPFNLHHHILDWALDPEHGGLPNASGQAFAQWLDHVWENWTEDPEVPVKDVLEGAVIEWCGGRSF